MTKLFIEQSWLHWVCWKVRNTHIGSAFIETYEVFYTKKKLLNSNKKVILEKHKVPLQEFLKKTLTDSIKNYSVGKYMNQK